MNWINKHILQKLLLIYADRDYILRTLVQQQ